MSPLASAKVLPCSEDRSRARSSNSLLDQLEKFDHDAGAALRIGGGPGREGRLRIGDRLLDLGLGGQRDLGLHLAGIGIEDVAETSRCALHLFAADEVADLTHEFSPWVTGFESDAVAPAPCAASWPIVPRFSAAGHGVGRRIEHRDRHFADQSSRKPLRARRTSSSR